jgi:hypothetical protein
MNEHPKACLIEDTGYCEGFISEINDAETGFFISSATKPGETGFCWVCGTQVSKYFSTSKEAFLDFLRIAASKF